MYKTLRTQVNLRFTNEDVFNNLVEPLKASRELSGLIVKLLTLYYTNKETRSLVRGMFLADDVLGMSDNDGVSSPAVSGTDMSLKDKTLERKPEDIQLEARIDSIESTINKVLSMLESKDNTSIPLEDNSLNKPYKVPDKAIFNQEVSQVAATEKVPEFQEVAVASQEVSQVPVTDRIPEPQGTAVVNQGAEDASAELDDILSDLLGM